MKIIKFFLSLFYYPKREIIKDKLLLKDFENRLCKADLKLDPLEGIVIMFNVVSEWQDSDKIYSYIKNLELVNYGQHNNFINQLKNLNLRIQMAGRAINELNKTNFGEKVTDENVWLGGISGLRTLPISLWKTVEPRNAEIENQAQRFMNRYIKFMLKTLETLIALDEK